MTHEWSFETTGMEVVAAFPGKVKDRTFLITGPSIHGIGAETAISLAKGKAGHLILAGRDSAKIQPVIDEIAKSSSRTAVTFIKIDLSVQASVRTAAAIIAERFDHIDVLINNAAIMACPYKLTADSVEMHLATNHIGHFLLTLLLLPLLYNAGEDTRIVNVSSGAHTGQEINFDDLTFNERDDYTPWKGYGRSKSANILFTVELADRLRSKHIGVFSLTPGSITSPLQAHMTPEIIDEAITAARTLNPDFKPPMKKTLQQGCSTTLVAALDPAIADASGAYLEDCKLSTAQSHAINKGNAVRLWTASEALAGQKFVVNGDAL